MLVGTGANLASPVDARLSEPVGGGGGGPRVWPEPTTGLEPGIGGTRLARLFAPGVVGDTGLGSYDPDFAVGNAEGIGLSSLMERLRAAANLGGASPVGVCADIFAWVDSSSSDSDPALGDNRVAIGAGRATHVSIYYLRPSQANLHSTGTGGGAGLPPGTAGALKLSWLIDALTC